MSHFTTILLTLFTVAAGIVGTAFWVVLILAGMANLKPDAAAVMRNWAIVTLIAGILITIASGWVTAHGRTGWGLLLGFTPFVTLIVSMIYVSIKR